MSNEWQKLVDELVVNGYLKTPRIIDAFKTIDRKDFVLPEYENEAYGNYPLPIGEGQTISQPLTVAFMLELLDPQPGEKILDVGSGSGWVTTLLAHIVGQETLNSSARGGSAFGGKPETLNNGKVVGVERVEKLCEFGQRNLKKYFPKERAKILCEDATSTIPLEGPFNKIIAGAAAPAGRASPTAGGRAAIQDIPVIWRDTLKVGGKIVAPIGGSIWRFTKISEAEWKEEEFPGFAFVPLVAQTPTELSVPTGRPTDTGGKTTSDDKKGGYRLPIILFAITLFFSFLVYATLAPLTLKAQKVEIEIPEGAGTIEIGELLKEKELTRSKWLFVMWAGITGRAARLQHGKYQLEGSVTIPEVVSRLQKGERFLNEITITTPEGWNLEDMAAYLETQGIAGKEKFFSIAGRPREFRRPNESQSIIYDQFPFLKERPAGASLEGYLFPDTYRIFRNSAPEDVVIKMLKNFDKKLAPALREDVSRNNKTLYEIITMASLIEKEVVSEEDRALVSGILWKRLELGIGLQVDATIVYLKQQETRDKKQETSAKISIEDTKIDSSYNTYKYRGLPPGPIANPGLSAIRAAIFPKPSPYLYYLSAPDGQTIFSKTLEEHNEAKAKYLR